jgi:hypothetical protein
MYGAGDVTNVTFPRFVYPSFAERSLELPSTQNLYSLLIPIIMGRRQQSISRSILNAIFRAPNHPDNKPPTLLARIFAFFSLFQLALARYRPELFKKLRNEVWEIEEDEYKESFRSEKNSGSRGLVSVGDLGYSGSVRSPSQTSSGRDILSNTPRPSSKPPTANSS